MRLGYRVSGGGSQHDNSGDAIAGSGKPKLGSASRLNALAKLSC